MTGSRRPTLASPQGPRSPRTGRRPWRGLPVVAAAAGALLVTGCGAAPGASEDSRPPVTVMTFAPEKTQATNMPGMPAMAVAYARWVNARGGVDGHPLKVITCNERNTAQGAAACAMRAVREKAAAVVGSYSQHADAFLPPLEDAGIPFIGGFGISEAEFSSYLSYPVNGGQPALLAGHGVQLADACERVALVRPDSATGDQLPELLNAGLAGAGNRTVDVLAPEDATDYTRAAARARETAGAGTGTGTDAPGSALDTGEEARPGCVTAALGERTETFFDSFRRLPDEGPRVKVSSVLSSVGQSLIDRTGGREGPFEGAFITGWYPDSGDARWAAMKGVIADHAFADNRIDPADSGVQTTWIAYTALAAVIESLDTDEVTPHKISRALDRGVRVTTGGLTPELRWEHQDMLGIPDFPRIVNSRVTFQVVRDGRLVAQREGFVDITETLAGAVSR
ncbi:ABC transporter substrate-binding protein [Streptomyces sp. NPDC020141]|uniref:ABC transporter substrate-binding protein n=1 Tax=Streptomyces sp. NPDC020141 TaxID=3365065 RepID=UPI0037B94011